jgi:hypothetical protein
VRAGILRIDGDFCLINFLDCGPFHFGDPDDYAHGKAREFPDEGGPVILVLEVPDAIVQTAATDWFPLSQGLVQFDPGSGLEELVAVWSQIASSAMIRSLTRSTTPNSPIVSISHSNLRPVGLSDSSMTCWTYVGSTNSESTSETATA